MILSTHTLAGAAVALALRNNPVIGVIAAFFSHFALDSVPHWHYRIFSKEEDESSPFGEKLDFGGKFLKDLSRTGLDLAVGLAISLAASRKFFPDYFWLTVLGALAGALPDALQVVCYRFPAFKPLYYFQRFHRKVHSKIYLDDRFLYGFGQQVIISAAFVLAMIFLV